MKRAVVVFSALGSMACIKPPDIVMVDRGTALEQQASGSFDEVERRLERAAVEPKPVPMTPEQLEALGIRPVASADAGQLTEADRVDALLVQHCIGEAMDGLLVPTPDACRGAANADETARAVERVNLARHQLWLWMHAQRTDVPTNDLRRAWRTLHVDGAACGSWIQGDDGQWRAKGC
ncbi:MAG TPA: DUF1318 domain-containing protein [Polyangiaceae bacterium]